MKALIKLYFVSWYRGLMGPMFALAFPPIILFILGQISPFNILAPTYILYCAITLGVQSFSISLVQFKSSSLIKRIGQTPITRTQFIFSLFLFNFLLILASSIFIIFVMKLYQDLDIVKTTVSYNETVTVSAKIIWSKIQWEWVAFISLLGSIFSISLGMLVGTLSSNVIVANGISLFIYVIFTSTGGIFLSLYWIRKSIVLEWISLTTPIRYLSDAILWAFKGEFAIDKQLVITKTITNGIINEVYEIGPIYFYLILTLGISAFLLFLSVKLFKW